MRTASHTPPSGGVTSFPSYGEKTDNLRRLASQHCPMQLVIDAKAIREKLNAILSTFTFRRVDTVKIFDPLEVRWYEPDGTNETYSVIEPREFTNDEYLRHVEVHAKRFHIITTSVPIREGDQYKKKQLFASSFRECDIDPVTLSLIAKQSATAIPHKGDLICGVAKPATADDRLPFFSQWFVCSEQFLRAYTMIMYVEHTSFAAYGDDETQLRRKMFSGNRLCSNSYRKWALTRQMNGALIDPIEMRKRFYHQHHEEASKKYPHLWAALVLIARYGEMPTSSGTSNVPQNLGPGDLECLEWLIPDDYAEKVVKFFTS